MRRINNDIFISMVRTVNIKGKEYYVITTFLEADGIEAPVQIHISLSHLNIEKREKIQKHANFFFNRTFKSRSKPPVKPVEKQDQKPWYKFW